VARAFFFRYYHARSTFGSEIIVNYFLLFTMSLDFLSHWLHSFCSRRGPAAAACDDDGVPANSTIGCARDGRLTILAKRTRAGANGGSAFWKEPAEETPTFPCADFPLRRLSSGPFGG
jgi:hypothetical protein